MNNFSFVLRPASRALRLSRIILLLFLSPFICHLHNVSVRAQSAATTAALVGVVRDAAGGTVADASVTLKELATNQTRSVKSSDDGSYRLNALPVGDYEVRVEIAGFAPYVNSPVTLAVGRTESLDITLRAGEVSAEVTVTDRPPAIDAGQTASTTSIDPERIAELPVSTRNYLQFALLAPGVVPSNAQGTNGAGASSGAPLADSGFTFGGLRPRSNSISIDGLDNTDETTGAARVALSPEIVREFQVVNNGLSAEFGGAAGGAINVVTKTGANAFHGSLFNFVQNEKFNARAPLANGQQTRPRFRRYQPGGSLGGPLRRDRLFFYAALEQEHASAEEESEINSATRTRINSALASGFAPRLAVRALDGRRFPVGRDETEAAGKLTYLAAERHTLNLRFSYTNARERGDAFNADALSDRTSRGSAYTKDYQLTASALSVLTPRVVNDLRFQFGTRRAITRTGDRVGPGVEIAGLARFGLPYDADSTRRETRVQIVESVSVTRANQELKTGATVNHVALKDEAREGFGGLYTFRTLEDFLAARPAAWRQAFGDARTQFGVTSFGAFAQDHWQASRALTLDLGVRYDAERLPSPFRTDKNNFSPRLGLAWSPRPAWVVRGGFGLFYDRLPLAFLNRALQKDGTRAFEQIALEADAARVFAATLGGRANTPFADIAPSIFRANADFVTPYSIQSHAGVERLLTTNTTLRADYLFTRGVHLPRTRNVNLPPPAVLTTANAAALGFDAPDAQQLGRLVFAPTHLDSRFDAIYQLEDSASSTYHGLTLALDKRLSEEWELLAAYTLSKTMDDASDFDEQPANPFDLRAERAASRQDARQRFVVSALFDLPFGEEEGSGGTSAGKENDNLLNEILGHVEIAPILTFNSGRPVNALTGADEERSRAYPLASRPLGFARNALRTPRNINLDLRVVKYVPFGEHSRLDLVVESFNVFNHPNVVAINPFFGSGRAPLQTFGAPTAFAAPRQMRFSIDFEF